MAHTYPRSCPIHENYCQVPRSQLVKLLHCPRVGPGRVEAIFAGPDPDPQGRATLSLALAPGRLDPGPVGSGQGRVRADPDPLIFSSEQNFFFKCCNFDILVDLYVFVKY